MKQTNIHIALVYIFLLSSFQNDILAQEMISSDQANQFLEMESGKTKGFQWLNQPKNHIISKGELQVEVEGNTDFFIDPENKKATATAPYLYKEIKGDFVATALIQPDFKDQWNAGALFMMIDDTHWIKFAFENSDATGKSIVSVVTRLVSDDANGAILNNLDQIWLKMIRKGDLYALHWSMDGKKYNMCRLAAMPNTEKVKIGLEAQSPVGETAHHKFLFFNLESRTVQDLRKGE
jgi:regulation of enolase protein 1 (concanavalin A-like superfamily)